MLENFIFSINCVSPLFIILLLGFFLRQIKIIDDNTVKKMNAVVFNVALPVMLFRDIAGSDFMNFYDLKLIIFSVGTTVIIFLLLWVVSAFLFKDRKKAGSFIQGSFRGNYAILGLPLITNILGGVSGKAILVTAFTVPLYNALSVVALSYFGSNEKKRGLNAALDALKNIIKNPVIIGVLAGVPFSVLKIEFPFFLKTSINYLSNLTTPLALIAIGATLTAAKVKSGFKDALIAALMKLVVTPIIFLILAYRLDFTGEAFVVLYVMYAVPSAVSSYIMASNMNCDSDLAANIVMVTTFLSIFTFTLGIYIIKTLGLI